MRIGLVRYINSRPLDYGFRKNPDINTVEDTPAVLYEMLSGGDLDAALISSVECLRNENKFAYCRTTGVCAKDEVSSILYLTEHTDRAPDRVLADNGSRTSVALLQLLLHRKFGKKIPFEKTDPEKIPGLVRNGTGGLLIGDIAFRYNLEKNNPSIHKIDLGKWWHAEEGLPFVFAMWAYPRSNPIADSFFEESLKYGESHMDEIVSEIRDISIRTYLTKTLHYRLGESENKSLDRFKSLLREADLL